MDRWRICGRCYHSGHMWEEGRIITMVKLNIFWNCIYIVIEGSRGISQITLLRGNVIEGSRGISQITSLKKECD